MANLPSKYEPRFRKNKAFAVIGTKLMRVWACLAMCGLLSCDEGERRDFSVRDQEYFPLVTGNYYIYDVEEIRYTLSEPETLRYELRHLVSDSFPSDAGGFTYVISRSQRFGGEGEWSQMETWSARRRNNEILLWEGNVPYVVLNFPLKENMSWDANLYNNETNPFSGEKTDLFSVIETGATVPLNDVSYSDCVVVEQEDIMDPILYTDFRQETYARNIGLISKTFIQLEYCSNENRGCVGKQIVDSGLRYTQTLKSYGRE